MSLQRAVAFILAQETGEVRQSTDGVSRWGISQAAHPELTAEAIRTMTPQGAAAIYSGPMYWGRIHGAELPEYLQLPMLDAAVNQGGGIAVRCLQTGLYVHVDGIIGPVTLRAATANTNQQALLARFTAARIASYAQDKEWGSDGTGWVTRAVSAALYAT